MSKLNKLVTNYPVSLSEDEVANLSSTLLPVVEACGGGGGGGITQYYGDGTYTEITGSHVITLTNETKQKINREIPTKVSDLTDSANYQTTAEMASYETTQHASQTYLTKSSADDDYAPLSTTADIESLKEVSGDFSQYYTKNETYSKNEVYTKEDVYQKTETSSKSELANAFIGIVTNSELETAIANVNITIEDLQNTVEGKQDILTYGYDENNSISSIDGKPLAGQGGTTYTEGNGISIASDTISISADYIQAITSVSGKQDELAFTYNTSNAITHINGSAIAGEGGGGTTVYSGTDGVYVDGNNIGLSANYKTQIEAVSSKLTQASADTLYAPISVTGDVDTLKSSSGNWDKVSDKLDTTAFSNVSGSFLTAHQSLDNYYTKTQVDSTFASATQLNDYLTTSDASTTYQPKGNYAPESVTATVNTLTGASAGWNEVTGKLDKSIYANASGNWEASYNVLTAYSAAGTWLTEHQSLTDYYKKSETSGADELSTEFAKYQPTGYYATSAGLTAGNQYAMTTTGWEVVQGGTSFTGVVTGTGLSGNGLSNSPLGIDTAAAIYLTNGSAKSATNALSADKAESAVSAKWLREGNAHVSAGDVTALQHWASSNSSTWEGVTAKLTTAQYATDSATFVTSSNDSISAAGEQYALTTTGWASVETAYLPTSGGTVSGLTTISGSNFDSTLEVKRSGQDNNYAHIGLNNSRGLSFKAFDDNASNNVQFDMFPNNSNSALIQIQHNGSTVGNLIPAVTATTTAGLTNDGILHIILES